MTSGEVTRSVGRGELAHLLEAHETWGLADYRDRDNPKHSWSCECGWKSTPTPYDGGAVDTLPAHEHTAAAILAALPGLTTTEPGEGFDDGGLGDLLRIANLEAEVKHLREYGDKQDRLVHNLRIRAEEAEGERLRALTEVLDGGDET